MPDKEVREFVQMAAGYSLLGSYSEYLFIAHGSGANGKSTFLNAARDVLGDYADEAPPDLLVQRREWGAAGESALAGLRGSRLVTTVETEQGKPISEVLVKQLTGEAEIKAKFMRQDYFTYTNTSAVWMATNHQPVVQGADYAIWRRIHLIPFEVMIPEDERQEPEVLRDRLRGERDGILRWFIEGLRRYRECGSKLDPPRRDQASHQGVPAEDGPDSGVAGGQGRVRAKRKGDRRKRPDVVRGALRRHRPHEARGEQVQRAARGARVPATTSDRRRTAAAVLGRPSPELGARSHRDGVASVVPVWELGDWRSGKKTRGGEPVEVEPEVVTVVTPNSVERFLGARGERLQSHLQRLRDTGRLVHEEGRLQQRVRFKAPDAEHGRVHRRCYVFRGRRRDIPVAPRTHGRARARVIYV